MAMAGQAQINRHDVLGERADAAVDWRTLAKRAYYGATALAGASLIYFIHPYFMHPESWFTPAAMTSTIQTIATVVVVSWFLVSVLKAEGTSIRFAPQTAVLVAAAGTVGWWALWFSAVSLAAIRIRMTREQQTDLSDQVTGFVGQIGIGIISVYAMLGAYFSIMNMQSYAPKLLVGPVFVLAILCAGVVQQTTNNILGAATYWILGRAVSVRVFSGAGFLASIWAYFLVAVYSMGGIIAIIAFYLIVANSRMMDKALAFVSALEKLENVQLQASALLQEIGRLTEVSTPGEEFVADVRYHATKLARHLGLPNKDVEHIALAASLHEIGKCKLRPELRTGVGLSERERSMYNRYSYLGGELLRQASVLVPVDVSEIVEEHTEHFDGTGYPYARKGTNIPVGARILAIARDYVRLLTGHEGADPVPKQEALARMRALAGSQYDPSLLDLLCQTVA